MPGGGGREQRHGKYGDGGSHHYYQYKDDVMNFSLGYRHIAENNPEGYKLLIILHIKMGERKGIRIFVYEYDDIKELANRLLWYFE